MSKFKWCFIGVGRLAHKVAAQLMASGRHEIVSCYARNYEKAATFSKEYGGRSALCIQIMSRDVLFTLF